MAAHPIQVLRHKCAFTHAQKKRREIRKHMYSKRVPVVSTYFYKTVNEHAHSTQHARVSIHDAHAVFVPHDWPRPLVQETALYVEKTREASGGHRVTSAKQTFNVFLCGLTGEEELVRERMCCAIALSLSISLSLIHTRSHTNAHTLFLSEHENTKLSFWTTTTKKKKMASVSYVLVSNKRKRKKFCADWCITDTD